MNAGTKENAETDGALIIISGPSGAGKSTVLDLLGRSSHPFEMSVSATTRPPRPGEQDGVDYHFLSQDEFARRRDAGEFLEDKKVFGLNWYGTLRQQVASGLQQGKWVVLEIDVEGALTVLQQMPEAITIFLHPGSMQELEKRLRNRGTESEESIQRRLEVARREIEQMDQYQHEVINEVPERAAADICEILGDRATASAMSKPADPSE